MKQAQLFLPLAVGDYTDFYSGIHHATNIGQDPAAGQPAAAELQVGADRLSRAQLVHRGVRHASCCGRAGRRKRPDEDQPSYGPDAAPRLRSRARLRHRPGQPARASRSRCATRSTTCSAWCCSTTGRRATSRPGSTSRSGRSSPRASPLRISPWIVTLDALAPYRCPAFPRAAGDPRPLPYLWDDEDQRAGGLAIDVEMHLRTAKMQAPVRLSRGSFRDSYWTVAQIVAHHTSNGCNLRAGRSARLGYALRRNARFATAR